MTLEKITLLRDSSQESAKISKFLKSKRVLKLLKENNIELREVNSSSYRLTPSLMGKNILYPHKGYNNILKYVHSLDPSEKYCQSDQE